jgi:hypothetical protein
MIPLFIFWYKSLETYFERRRIWFELFHIHIPTQRLHSCNEYIIWSRIEHCSGLSKFDLDSICSHILTQVSPDQFITLWAFSLNIQTFPLKFDINTVSMPIQPKLAQNIVCNAADAIKIILFWVHNSITSKLGMEPFNYAAIRLMNASQTHFILYKTN